MDLHKYLVNNLVEGFTSDELFGNIIEFCPYPIQLYSIDGTAIMINDACLKLLGIKSKEKHVGIYNVFNDPIVKSMGFDKRLMSVLDGETLIIQDFFAPYAEMINFFDVEDKDISSLQTDIATFPIKKNNTVVYFVSVFNIRKIYKRKDDISKAKEYISKNWYKKYSIKDISRHVNISEYHFSRLFKKHVGITPYNYYMNIKIDKLKEMLLDLSLSISDVFSKCGIDYHGHFSKVFKERVGMSPIKYRKLNIKE